jgi:hypothetical protein
MLDRIVWIFFTVCMKKSTRMPNMSEQYLLDGVRVRLIGDGERARYDAFLDEQHYLKSGQLVGEQLRYVAECDGRWLALLSWSAGSYHLADRDGWIGWSDEQRRCRLPFVVNNSRFLILGGVDCLNLASRVMKLCLQRLSSDWASTYGHEVLVAESFVDPELFRGTAYKASGWDRLGETKGYSRVRREYYTAHDRPKQLYVKALRRGACRLLSSKQMPESWRSSELKPKVRCRTHAPELKTVREHFESIADYRTGTNWSYSLTGLLALVFCAALAGVSRGQRDLAEYSEDLSQGQLRALGFRRNRKTRRIPCPKETTFFRLLSKVDPSELQEALLKCLDSLLGPEEGMGTIIIDGKALRSSRGVEIVSAFSGETGRWLGSEMVEDKSNEIPAARKLLERCNADGAMVLTDALHTQTLSAREIVQDCGGDYLMTVKANQKGLLENLRDIHSAHKMGAFPPSDGRVAAR